MSMASLPEWQQFAGVAGQSLDSLSSLQQDVQWLIVERINQEHGTVLLCAGNGPLKVGDKTSWPLPEADSNISGGTLLSIPLTGSHAQLEGFLGLWLPDSQPKPGEREMALLKIKASLFTALLHELHNSQRLLNELEASRRDAETDPLTGLYNRRGWNMVMEREEARCRRYHHPCSLLVIDLNRLKQTNDQQGHAEGDRLLNKTAQVLSGSIRQPDMVARLGGDEFGILLVETDASRAATFIERLRRTLRDANIDASVGIADWQSDESFCETLVRADQAMYEDKRQRAG